MCGQQLGKCRWVGGGGRGAGDGRGAAPLLLTNKLYPPLAAESAGFPRGIFRVNAAMKVSAKQRKGRPCQRESRGSLVIYEKKKSAECANKDFSQT